MFDRSGSTTLDSFKFRDIWICEWTPNCGAVLYMKTNKNCVDRRFKSFVVNLYVSPKKAKCVVCLFRNAIYMRIPWYISYIHLYINISCFLIFFSVRFINWLKSSIMKFSPGQPSLILNRRLFEMNNMCILVTSAINWKRVFLQWIITLCQLFNAHYLRTAHVFLIKRQ